MASCGFRSGDRCGAATDSHRLPRSALGGTTYSCLVGHPPQRGDADRTGGGVPVAGDRHPVRGLHVVGSEHLLRPPLRRHRPPGQQDDPLPVLRAQRQVVGGDQRGDPARLLQLRDDLVERDPVPDVEERRRLVQQHHPRPLRDRPGHGGPLALPRGDLRQGPIPQPGQFRRLHRPVHLLPILRRRSPEEPLVGEPAEPDIGGDRHRKIDRRVLPHDGEEARHLPATELPGGAAAQQHLPLAGREDPRQDPDQRALPGPVGTEEDRHFSRREVDAHAAQDVAVPVSESHSPGGQYRVHDRPPLRRSR